MSDSVTYLDPAFVADVRITDAVLPLHGQTVTGYGSRLPTVYLLRCSDGRTRRVRAMCYGNAASLYVTVGGETRHLGTAVEGLLEDARDRLMATA